MPDVQFNDENRDLGQFRSRAILGEATTPVMAKWLMRWGIVKDEKAAGLVLIAIAVIALAIAVYFFFF